MTTGKVALVTGGSEGIGFASAKALVDAGWSVVLLSRSQQKLDAAASRLAAGDRVACVAADVADEASVASAVERTMARFGRLDALVNSAGVSMRANRRLADSDTKEWRRIIDINLTGTYLMCRACLPILEKAPQADVVNVQSTASHVAKGTVGVYAASKFGVRALTESLIDEYQHTDVRITAVSPGAVATTIWGHKTAPPNDETLSTMIEPRDIGDIVAWLIARPRSLHIPNITVTPTRFRPMPAASPAPPQQPPARPAGTTTGDPS